MIQTTATGDRLPILSTGKSAEYQGFQIEYNWDVGKNIIGLDVNGHAYFPTTGTFINDGAWHTVVVTYDGTTVCIYVDGRLDNLSTKWSYGPGTMATTMNTQGNNIFLGRSNWDGNLWKGSLKNVMFYDYVISVSSSTSGKMLFSSGKVQTVL